MKLLSTDHVGVVHQPTPGGQRLTSRLDVVGLYREFIKPIGDAIEQLLRFQIEHEVAVDTEVLLDGRLLLTAGAGNRRCLLGFVVGLDGQTVHRSVLLFLGLPGEHRDVPGDDGRAPSPSLPILDERLRLVLRCEPVGVRLPEVGRRDPTIHTGAISRLAEALEEALVGVALRLVQARPQVIVRPPWMLSEPLLDVRRREDEVDVVLAALPVDADFQTVVSIRNVADAHVVELTPSEPPLELEKDEATIAGVPGRFDHRFDVRFQPEHIGFVGRGVVVARGLRRDPLVGVRDLVPSGDVLGEQPEGDAVVPVGLLGAVLDVVRVVDPADHSFRGILRFVEDVLRNVLTIFEDRVVEADGRVLAHPDVVPEELLVAGPAVVLATELQLVTEREEELAIGAATTTEFVVGVVLRARPLAELRAEHLDRSLVVGHGPIVYPWAGKGMLESPPPASTVFFTSPQLSRQGWTSGQPHAAIAPAEAQGAVA